MCRIAPRGSPALSAGRCRADHGGCEICGLGSPSNGQYCSSPAGCSISWNVQACRGVDGIVDPDRIARRITALGPVDVICLQEVSCNAPDAADDAAADQAAALARRFDGFEVHFGAAIDRAGGAGGRRWRFGNMILTRPPAVQLFHHALPGPADGANKAMPRQATEIVIEGRDRALRVMTTHLDYHSPIRRAAQIDALRAVQAEVAANHRTPPLDTGSGPFAAAPRPPSLVLCGDFNFVAGDDHYRRMLAAAEDPAATLHDAWPASRGAAPHDPTCGVFDRAQWPEGPHCRDFLFVTEDVAGAIRAIAVDLETDASDHQPVRIEIDW
jgi:endonuclease/exonuclease/phosphatase family metal-dependent hydrolase